jgi:hypothetical protein
MNNEYTIVTEYFNGGNVMINRLYIGKNREDKNEVEIFSKKVLDKKIIDVMDKQAKKLEKNPKLNPIVETITL